METSNQTPNLSAIPPDVWQELTNAVARNGGVNNALWFAYHQLPVLFSMTPHEVEAYMRERGQTCKTL